MGPSSNARHILQVLEHTCLCSPAALYPQKCWHYKLAVSLNMPRSGRKDTGPEVMFHFCKEKTCLCKKRVHGQGQNLHWRNQRPTSTSTETRFRFDDWREHSKFLLVLFAGMKGQRKNAVFCEITNYKRIRCPSVCILRAQAKWAVWCRILLSKELFTPDHVIKTLRYLIRLSSLANISVSIQPTPSHSLAYQDVEWMRTRIRRCTNKRHAYRAFRLPWHCVPSSKIKRLSAKHTIF